MSQTAINKIKSAITLYNMNLDDVTVALSGGADSVALLHALLELGFSVQACHVNHNLRGSESDRDQAFVSDLCDKLKVKLTLRSIDVKALKRKHQSIEEAAREVRYAFFGEFSTVATAHTASDNAETVLLNLIRGTGLKGLCGIPPIRSNIVRPLILCERADIEKYCRIYGLNYVTDSTNADQDFTRNKVRLSLIPLIKEINPSFDFCITRMCETLRQDSDYLQRTVAQSITANDGDFAVDELKSLEKPLLTRIIMELLSQNNVSPSNLRISQIIGIIETGSGKINLEKHKFALIKDGKLKIEQIFQNYH